MTNHKFNMPPATQQQHHHTTHSGQTVTVAKIHGEGPVRRRIMDMGLTKGVEVFVRKVAPLGDPMELNIRGYELSIRKADAEMVELV